MGPILYRRCGSVRIVFCGTVGRTGDIVGLGGNSRVILAKNLVGNGANGAGIVGIRAI